MIYPSNFEQKIGFAEIRRMLGEGCLCALGKEKVESMDFSADYAEIRRRLCLVDEFMRIIREEDGFPDQFFFDARASLRKIKVEGMWMDEAELFDLRRSLQTINDIVRFLRSGEEEPRYPALAALAGGILTFPKITADIDKILDKYGKIKDTASPELQRIRRELAFTFSGISRSLNGILRQAQSDGLVDKDAAPSMRDGRLVIPVAPALKRKIRGIVHDESASGKTVYVEPAEVVEANNRIRELEGEERREVIRILVTFADSLRPFAEDILASYGFLAEVDFIRSKAAMALSMGAIVPVVESRCVVDWSVAVHPLLQAALAKQGKKVVPLDILLDERQRILIISGPNAGGKSVCLKTVGLLQYMLQCGLPITLAESSRVGVFASIFIDIGDEQSIENDLSTYSSHLLNMKNMIKHCDGRSLILIDEFGGGTEPQIGGAIAEAVLKRFNGSGTFGIITTHYQNLKHYAEDHEGVVNGAMLYDRHEMRPLFQLRIGNPGSSFAVEIARKIGLPEEVIKDASDIVGQDYINADKYLQDIVRDKRYWESKRQNIRQQEKHVEEAIARYEKELQELHAKRKEILSQAREQAEQILSKSNAVVENTIRSIKEAQAEKEKTRAVRKELEDFKESVGALDTDTKSDLITQKMERLREKQNRRKEKKQQKGDRPQPQLAEKKAVQIAVGDFVRMKGQNTVGKVTVINGKNAKVAFGMVELNVKLDSLEPSAPPVENNVKKAASYLSVQTQDSMYEKKLNFKQDIDVRGMRGDEAVQAVTYFIDDAIQVGVPRVRILHGTGTGILRTLIRNYLDTVPGVKSFRDEHVQFGGAGITVVDLD